MSSLKTRGTKGARKTRAIGAGSLKIGPTKKAVKVRIREALSVDRAWFDAKFRELETSQRALADALGRNASAVTLLLRGERSLRTDELPVLARFFDVSEDEVMRRLGVLPAHPLEGSKTVELTGWVDGALEVHHGAPQGPRRAPRLPGLGADVRALRVQSAGSPNAFLDGAVIYYSEPGRGVPPEAVERLCVVRLAGAGPDLLRVVRQGYVRGSFNLFDQRGALLEQNVLLAAASPVLWLRM